VPTPTPTLTAADAATTLCPDCQSRLVTEYNATPWCERCEWNLDAFTPEPHVGRVDRFLSRLDHNAGYDLSTTLFKALAGKTIERPGVSGPYCVLLAISAAVLSLCVGLLALGVWLVLTAPFLVKAAGLLSIGLALVFRPRLGSVRKVLAEVDPLTETDAPALFGLVRRVATTIGAPMPHTLAISSDLNAFAAVVGISRRRIMALGLPLWSSLRPQERVALIGHELGHFINADNHRNLVAQPALMAFGTAAQLIDPADLMRTFRQAARENGFIALTIPVVLLILPFMYALRLLLVLLHLGVNAIGARESQRAEYYADDLAAQAAGSSAAIGLFEVLTLSEGLIAVIGGRARSREGAAGWREGVEKSRAKPTTTMNRLRQLSVRTEASLFTSHPQSGLRVRMIEATPFRQPAVVLTEAEAAMIDAELARYEERYRREIAESW